MSRLHGLKVFINQRLAAAVEDICGHFERTITEYEAEMDRKLLHVVSAAETRLRAEADVQQLLVVKEVQQQDWSSSLDQEDPEPPHIKEEQEDPEPPHIKEEQEELWTSQEGEQLQGLEEAGIKFSFTPVKSEDDEEEAQSSQLHQRLTEHMETETDGEDCGGPEPDRNVGPHRHVQLSSSDEVSQCNKQETDTDTDNDDDDEEDWKVTRQPQSGLNSLNNYVVSVSEFRCSAGEKPFSCSVCKKTFRFRQALKPHMRIHTGEKPFSCSVCEKSFRESQSLQRHMRIHTGEKPFSCSVCAKSFSQNGDLKIHMRIHTGEKPFSCSVCEKCFIKKENLKRHLVTHRNHSAAAEPAR